jgi:hypothetical protein
MEKRTHGKPVADLLTHPLPLPFTISYENRRETTTVEDEEGILLAFPYRDRLHHLALALPASSLSKFMMAMDEQFPVLERMHICISHRRQCKCGISEEIPSTTSTPLLTRDRCPPDRISIIHSRAFGNILIHP